MNPTPADQGRRLVPMLTEFFWHSRFGVQVVAITLIFLGCVSFFIYQAFEQQYQNVAEIFRVVNPELKHELVFNDIIMRNVVFLIISILAYIVAMVILIIRSRHKYSGPLVSVQKFIEAVTRGEYSHRIIIRKGDEMQELVVALNEMAEHLERRHGPLVQDGASDRVSGS
jgi:methyl-accepting chemotaxis protein